mgnify:FL=1
MVDYSVVKLGLFLFFWLTKLLSAPFPWKDNSHCRFLVFCNDWTHWIKIKVSGSYIKSLIWNCLTWSYTNQFQDTVASCKWNKPNSSNFFELYYNVIKNVVLVNYFKTQIYLNYLRKETIAALLGRPLLYSNCVKASTYLCEKVITFVLHPHMF